MAAFFSFRFSFSVYKLISRPPDQIIPLITKSFKKNLPHRRHHNAARNWTVFFLATSN